MCVLESELGADRECPYVLHVVEKACLDDS